MLRVTIVILVIMLFGGILIESAGCILATSERFDRAGERMMIIGITGMYSAGFIGLIIGSAFGLHWALYGG